MILEQNSSAIVLILRFERAKQQANAKREETENYTKYQQERNAYETQQCSSYKEYKNVNKMTGGIHDNSTFLRIQVMTSRCEMKLR